MRIHTTNTSFNIHHLDALAQTLHTLATDYADIPPGDHRHGIAVALRANCLRRLDNMRISQAAANHYHATAQSLHNPTTRQKTTAALDAIRAHPYTRKEA